MALPLRPSVIAAAVMALLAPLAAAGPGVQLSSSVMVFQNTDLDGGAQSRCANLLRNAASHGSKSVNIVVTQYWIDNRFKSLSRSCNPDNWAVGSRVDEYCYYGHGDGCQAFNPGEIDRLTAGLTDCLTSAFDSFDSVLLSPHLDDGTRTGHWRNMLVFDPLQPDANGYSYEDIMVTPLVKAAAAALAKQRAGGAKKTLWFGMQGEMGGTVFFHPKSYQTLSRRIRGALATAPGEVLVGILLNHGYLPGVVNRGPDASGPPAQPSSEMAPYSGGWGPVLPLDEWPRAAEIKRELPATKELLRSHIDFLGISNYNRAPADVQPSDMDAAAAKYDAELTAMGIPLRSLIAGGAPQVAAAAVSAGDVAAPVRRVRFIYNEVAIGGGVSECGNVAATEPSQVGRFPWLGMFRWSKDTNPFRSHQPDSVEVPARTYMRSWYGALLHVLRSGGLSYPVSGAYVWNCASWDVQGVYEPGYADGATIRAIRRHNAAVAGAAVSAAEAEAA